MKDVITENYKLLHGDCLERMKEIESGGAFKRYHPTQKSVKLLEYLLSVCSNENDTVFYLVAVAPQE